MNICVVSDDRVVVVDGEAENFDLGLDANIWAIQWDGAKGEVEYKDNTPNKEIVDFSEYEYLASKHKEQKIRRNEEEVKKIAEREDSMGYKEKRKRMYDELNQFELISDDSIAGNGTSHRDAILAIKAKIPKN